jgi:type I restriction enzyme S subunit
LCRDTCEGFNNSNYSFFAIFLIYKASDFKEIGQGGAQPNISQTIIKQFPIPIPPLAEQKRIVTKLDSLFAHTHRARQELDHIPKLIERYKQAILSAAFRGDLTADWRKENNQLSQINSEQLKQSLELIRIEKNGKIWKKKNMMNIQLLMYQNPGDYQE